MDTPSFSECVSTRVCESEHALLLLKVGGGAKMRVVLVDMCASFFALRAEKVAAYLVLFGCFIYFGCSGGCFCVLTRETHPHSISNHLPEQVVVLFVVLITKDKKQVGTRY